MNSRPAARGRALPETLRERYRLVLGCLAAHKCEAKPAAVLAAMEAAGVAGLKPKNVSRHLRSLGYPPVSGVSDAVATELAAMPLAPLSHEPEPGCGALPETLRERYRLVLGRLAAHKCEAKPAAVLAAMEAAGVTGLTPKHIGNHLAAACRWR